MALERPPAELRTRTYAQISGKTRSLGQSGAKSGAQPELALLWVEITAHPLTQNRGVSFSGSWQQVGIHRIHVGPTLMARRRCRFSLDLGDRMNATITQVLSAHGDWASGGIAGAEHTAPAGRPGVPRVYPQRVAAWLDAGILDDALAAYLRSSGLPRGMSMGVPEDAIFACTGDLGQKDVLDMILQR